MKVLEEYSVKGRGTIIVVDNCPPEVRLGDIITDGTREWIIVGADGMIPPKARHHETGLALKEVDSTFTVYPEKGAKLTVKQRPLMDREVGRCTLQQLVDALNRSSEERQELAGHLKKLKSAIMHLELHMGQEDRMAAFKEMHEAFNAIPPKWLHK